MLSNQKGLSALIYLDNAATTKPCEAAKAGVMKGLEVFGMGHGYVCYFKTLNMLMR